MSSRAEPRPATTSPSTSGLTGPAASRLAVAVTVEQLAQPVPGGSGTYVRALVEHLTSGDQVLPVPVAAAGSGTLGLPVTVRHSRLPRAALYQAWSRFGRPRADRIAPGVDVVHATTWAVPACDVPLVVTVHDLAFLRDPSQFTAHGNRFFRRALDTTASQAAAVVVPSAATAADCTGYGIDADRVHVVPHGVDVDADAASRVPQWRERFDVHGPYLLWCGTFEPRKNVPLLVAGYARARRDGLDATLVLVGPDGWGDARADVERAISRLPHGAVRRLGRLSSDDLQTAYAGADAFAFPSLWEGFGLPVLEAMAYGVPVMTSRDTAMAEIVGEVGTLVDPRDVRAIADGLLTVAMTPVDARVKMSDVARRYSWSASALAHVAVYRAAAG